MTNCHRVYAMFDVESVKLNPDILTDSFRLVLTCFKFMLDGKIRYLLFCEKIQSDIRPDLCAVLVGQLKKLKVLIASPIGFFKLTKS